jgi:hypothetical protein
MGLALEGQHGWSLGEPAMKRKKPFPAQIMQQLYCRKVPPLFAAIMRQRPQYPNGRCSRIALNLRRIARPQWPARGWSEQRCNASVTIAVLDCAALDSTQPGPDNGRPDAWLLSVRR